jgi:hypothetical protein
MFNRINPLFPTSKFLSGLRLRHPHEIIPKKFVCFISSSFHLRPNECSLSIMGFFITLDFKVTFRNFVDNPILVVDQLVLVAEVRFDEPSFHCTSLHKILHFPENSLPIFLGSFLSLSFETESVENISHAFVLQSCGQKGSSISISVMLQCLFEESKIPCERIVKKPHP